MEIALQDLLFTKPPSKTDKKMNTPTLALLFFSKTDTETTRKVSEMRFTEEKQHCQASFGTMGWKGGPISNGRYSGRHRFTKRDKDTATFVSLRNFASMKNLRKDKDASINVQTLLTDVFIAPCADLPWRKCSWNFY